METIGWRSETALRACLPSEVLFFVFTARDKRECYGGRKSGHRRRKVVIDAACIRIWIDIPQTGKPEARTWLKNRIKKLDEGSEKGRRKPGECATNLYEKAGRVLELPSTRSWQHSKLRTVFKNYLSTEDRRGLNPTTVFGLRFPNGLPSKSDHQVPTFVSEGKVICNLEDGASRKTTTSNFADHSDV